MPHQCPKRVSVRIPRGVAKRAEKLDWTRNRNGAAIIDLNARKASVVLLHPVRRKTGCAILPASEPEKNDVQIVLSGLGDDSIHLGVIELPLFGLELRPGNTHEHGVQVV